MKQKLINILFVLVVNHLVQYLIIQQHLVNVHMDY